MHRMKRSSVIAGGVVICLLLAGCTGTTPVKKPNGVDQIQFSTSDSIPERLGVYGFNNKAVVSFNHNRTQVIVRGKVPGGPSDCSVLELKNVSLNANNDLSVVISEKERSYIGRVLHGHNPISSNCGGGGKDQSYKVIISTKSTRIRSVHVVHNDGVGGRYSKTFDNHTTTSNYVVMAS